MVEPTAGRTRPALLIHTAVPGRSGELYRSLEAAAASGIAGAAKVTEVFYLDRATPAGTFEEVRGALRTGVDGLGHALLVVCGDVADELSAKRLADLRAAAMYADGLAVVGVYDSDRELSRLTASGIERTVRLDRFAVDLGGAAAAAVNDIRRARAEEIERLAATQTRTQIIVNEGGLQDGLLPGNGLVVFHANKGGTGKSTLASSVAYGLSLSRPVVIADLNSSGGFIHAHFGHWLVMPQNGGYETFEDLFRERGLIRLARNMNHAEAQVVAPDHVRSAVVEIEDPKLPGWKITLLPGVRAQEDYEVGSPSIAAKEMQYLITKDRWAEQLLNSLSRLDGGRGYVVVDTDTTRYAQLTRVPLRMADLLCVVVDGRDQAALEDEFVKTENLLSDHLTGFTGRLMIIVNQLYEGKMRAIAPDAPSFRQAEELFRTLRPANGKKVEVVPAPFDPAIRTKAGRLSKPVLALNDWESPLTGAMVDIVNRINGSLTIDTGRKKMGGIFGRKR